MSASLGKWWHGKYYKHRRKAHRQFRDGIPRLLPTQRKQCAKPLHTGWAAVAVLLFAAYLAAAIHFN